MENYFYDTIISKLEICVLYNFIFVIQWIQKIQWKNPNRKKLKCLCKYETKLHLFAFWSCDQSENTLNFGFLT